MAADSFAGAEAPAAEGASQTSGSLALGGSAKEQHAIARRYLEHGDHKNAIRSYDFLFTRYPTYSGRGEALLEQARAYEALGMLAKADAALAKAQTVEGVAARAKTARSRISSKAALRAAPAKAKAATKEAQ